MDSMMTDGSESRFRSARECGPRSVREFMLDSSWGGLMHLCRKAVSENRLDYLVHAHKHRLPMTKDIPDKALVNGCAVVAAWALVEGWTCKSRRTEIMYRDELIRWYFPRDMCLVKGCRSRGEGLCTKHRTEIASILGRRTPLYRDLVASVLDEVCRS